MSEHRTLLHWIDSLDRFAGRPAVVVLGEAETRQISYEQLEDLSRQFAADLTQRGIGRGDRVALIAPSSPAWIAACLGTIRARATPAPLDVQMGDDSLVHVVHDSQPRLVFADRKQASRLKELELDASLDVLLLDDEDRRPGRRESIGDAASDLPPAAPEDEAVLFYTSGTTGPPKGVPLTHENIAVQVDVLLGADLVDDDDRVLLPLPLHHVYPLVVGLLTPLARGLPIVLPYSLSGPHMVRALKETGVTIVIGVPRLYRALYEGIQDRVASSGRMAKVAIRSAMAISSWLRRQFGVRTGKWLLRPLHQQFGPQLRVAACGGSPLDDDLAWKLESLGWQVAIGYGLTETSPLLTLNPPGKAKIGTVGQVIPRTELRIDDSDEEVSIQVDGRTIGEILARGPSVFGGYRNLPEKTDEALTDEGWFRTGDLGFIDEEGYLHVTGRKGTMIVTESGENVRPDEVESAYAEHPAIREVGVLKDQNQLVGLIVPETSEVSGDDLEESIAQAVETQSRNLASYQRISDFQLTRELLPRTRLGKIQRHKLRERFERVAKGEGQTTGTPISIDEMDSHDRALLNDPAAEKTWQLLCHKHADQRLTPDTSMQLDLGIDSLEWMNLSLAIRRQARVEIDEEAIGKIETVRDLLEEAAGAAAAGEQPSDADPLEDPEAALSEDQRRYLQPHGRFTSLLSRGVFSVSGLLMRFVFRLEVQGADRLPDSPMIIAPNHVSYLDPLAVAAALPWRRLRETYWGGWTGTMFTNFIMRWFSRLTHVVPVDPQRRVMSSLAFGAAVLDRGHNLVWFPEGERSTDGQLQSFRSGIGLLLERHSIRIIPTAIEGAYEALPPGRWLPRPRRIRVTFGQPLEADALLGKSDQQEPHEQISSGLRDAVASLLSHDRSLQ